MEIFNNKFFQYLCPPGNGVFTVHTAKENKEKLHKGLYQTIESSQVVKNWEESFKRLADNKKSCLLGVTMDTGGGIQRGANWGPLFIRNQMLNHSKQDYFDLGDIKTIPHLLHDKYLNKQTIKSCQNALYKDESNLPVSALSITEDFCTEFYKNFPNQKIIGLGGDHSVSYALVAPWIKAKRAAGKKVAIIHFDAHTDLMQKRLGIDICFGSWAYHMLELLEQPSDLIQFGIRSSGQDKTHWESTLGVQQFWANEINENGTKSYIEKTINDLKKKEIDELYISFDIDALDAQYASATGTPEEQGMNPTQCIEICQALAAEFLITGADLVEVAPFVRSVTEKDNPEPETTLNSSQLILDHFIEIMK